MYTAVAEEGSSGMERETAIVVFNLLLDGIKIVVYGRVLKGFCRLQRGARKGLSPTASLTASRGGITDGSGGRPLERRLSASMGSRRLH
ncbi:hypothetical protein BHM03_00005556 [Ensete ventricosum]|nr:hypothetical protein BHM03_00005556 [Ensete ventricosum]